MKKIIIILTLLGLYAAYSGWVYTIGTSCKIVMTEAAKEGKILWQIKNCQSCHQLYGLGGYMGSDLTLITTAKQGGVAYTRGILLNGGSRMPNFHFTTDEADELIAYLSYVGNTFDTTTK